MMPSYFDEVADDVFCIDTGLHRHGLAACYLLRRNGRLAFVDTGTANSVPRLLAVIAALGHRVDQVDLVLLTHVHLDHAGGGGGLMAICPNARLLVHPKGAAHMIRPHALTKGAMAVYGAEAFDRDYGRPVAVEETRLQRALDQEAVSLEGRTLVTHHTPGHANHHVCVEDVETGGFFTGDAFGISYHELDSPDGPILFAPTTPVEFDPDLWVASLDRLSERKPKTAFLTHYGRVDRPLTRLEGLKRNIRDLADIALEERCSGNIGCRERIRSRVASLLVGRAHEYGCPLEDDRIRRVLAHDIELNAQGLEVWLHRRVVCSRQSSD